MGSRNSSFHCLVQTGTITDIQYLRKVCMTNDVPGQMLHGQMLHGQMLPGQMLHGQMLYGMDKIYKLEMSTTVLSLRGGWVKVETKAISVQQAGTGTELGNIKPSETSKTQFTTSPVWWSGGWVDIES